MTKKGGSLEPSRTLQVSSAPKVRNMTPSAERRRAMGRHEGHEHHKARHAHDTLWKQPGERGSYTAATLVVAGIVAVLLAAALFSARQLMTMQE
ncbi:hypothetical protein CLOM_g24157 [Closterium sp. NIES-68]|nr:hypothetical protein CLOM_g24157 [Closterium sp. NIES-68]GJP70572.1 hypothetical protein CLOP_g1498 [Closterium sp. NIES-67]